MVQSQETPSTDSPAKEETLLSLKILPLVKDRQLQHGLRHGDYQRYHGYCSRRLRRLREVLKIPQGDRRHFKRRDVTSNEIESDKGDSRYLEIPMTMAERAWASAMELKQDANTEPRKRFHMVARLRKALGLAEGLMQLANCPKVDARTKLECEAYVAFITATLNFETEQWEEAMVAFKKAQSIYSQISKALGDHPEATAYSEKTTEMLPAMRFCAYKTGAELKISELDSEFQSAAIKEMISQKPKMSEVTFRKYKITVPSEKIAALLVRIEEFEKKGDKKVEMYEEILVDLRDAIQTVRDMQKPEQAAKGPKLTMMLSYLLFLRLRLTNSRTELMIEEKNQPKDCIRLLEMILHNLSEMKTISGLDADEDFVAEVDDESFVYKGIRCRYLAEIYAAAKKYAEALALYSRCEEYLNRAQKSLVKSAPCFKLIKENKDRIQSSMLECKARAILASTEGAEDATAAFKLTRPEELLIDRLDQYVLDESLISGEPNVAVFPPEYEPISCKPLFFDLALNHIEVPMEDIAEKAGMSTKKSPAKESSGSGLSGFVKGLWGWGSGK